MIIPIQDIQGLVYNEYINIDNALKILKNWDNIISKFPEGRKRFLQEKQKDFDPLISLKKICKNKLPINNVNYLPSKQLKNMGRLFAQSASLQNLPREFRGAIGENYYDLDMKNAHPTILLQYCKKNDIKCETLEHYVNNRDEIIKTIMNEYELDKDDVKQLFLSIMNGGKREGITNEFFMKFKTECERIHTFISSLNPKILKDVSKRKDFNIKGSLTNIILCNLENEILLYSVQYLMKEGYNVDVLVFDGCMIRKEEGKYITDDLLNGLSVYVLEKTGYDIKFVEKKLDSSIDLNCYENTKNDIDNDITYYKDKEEFEKTHLKIVHPPIYISIVKDKIELQSRECLLQSYQEKKTYNKIIFNGKEVIEKTPFIKCWINDENIRKYDNIVFTPPPIKHDLNDYNTWRGFENEKKVLPANFNIDTNEYVLRFREYIYNLVNGRENYINYLISWIANIIQYPAYRSQVCIVLYSLVEGVGKSKLIELIENVVGENYSFTITDISNQLFGKHSMAEFERLFISLNEIKGKDTYSNSETFKQRITDPKRDFEPKGLKSFNGINYVNYICSTNNINSVNAGENDRRFCPITCNNKKANDKEYFMKFEIEIVKNDEAIRCIFEYLKQFPIEKYVPNRLFQNYRPSDDALYQDLKEYNREIEWDFLESFVKRNKTETIFKVETKNVWLAFENFLENNGEKRRMEGITSKKFHFSFKQRICQVIQLTTDYEDAIIYSTKEKRIAKNGNDCYVFNIDKLKKYFKFDSEDFINDNDNDNDDN
jgi:hypothetical protein